LYGDTAIRNGLANLVQPLRNPGIDRIVMRHEHSEQAIEKEESTYFESQPLELEAPEGDMEGERDAILVVSKLSFIEGTTWTFIEKGATLTAKIEDPKFWKDVHHHRVTFGEGDSLRVRIKWEIIQNRRGGLTAKNTILRVHSLLPRPNQMSLAEGGTHKGD
jgi:hypothetical protein